MEGLTFLPQEEYEDKEKEVFESYIRLFPLTKEDLSDSILDVGTGTGRFISYIRKILKNDRAYGIELRESRFQNKGAEGGVVGNGLNIPFADRSIRTVIAKNYLPMFAAKSEGIVGALDEMLRVVSHGGKVCADIPIPEHQQKIKEKYAHDEATQAHFQERYSGSLILREYLKRLDGNGYRVEYVERHPHKVIVIIHKV